MTLEGLSISYFLRTSRMYDTLLQMGRWFGYRKNYEDMPRVWMTAEMEDQFRRLSGVEQDMFNELQSFMTGKSPAEVEELKKQLADAIKERDAFGSQAKEYETKYTTLEGGLKQREAQAKIEAAYTRALESIQYREGISSYEKKGFEAEIRSKYKPEFSDDGTYKVLGPDGSIVMNKHKAQTLATLDELAKAHAEEAKLTGGAPQAGTPVRKTVSTTSTTPAQPAQPQTPAVRRTGPPVMPVA
jgi:hypothetical protein